MDSFYGMEIPKHLLSVGEMRKMSNYTESKCHHAPRVEDSLKFLLGNKQKMVKSSKTILSIHTQKNNERAFRRRYCRYSPGHVTTGTIFIIIFQIKIPVKLKLSN